MSPRAESVARQGEQTRQVVLDAAIELFGEHGYRGCSLTQIARKAGIVQSGLHHHFGSKERLLLGAIEEHYPVAVARPDIVAVAEGRASFSDEIVRVMQQNIRDPHLVRFFSVMTGESLTQDHPASEYFAQRYARVREAFSEAICTSKGIAGSEARQRVQLLVTVALASMDGLQMQWLRDESVDVVGGVRLIADMLEDHVGRLADRETA